MELNALREETSLLRREKDEAKNMQTTCTTKYEALERNFKQVRVVRLHVHRRNSSVLGSASILRCRQ